MALMTRLTQRSGRGQATVPGLHETPTGYSAPSQPPVITREGQLLRRLALQQWLSLGAIVLLAILMVVVGVQFVSLGLIGEMLVRTYHESQRKPIYRVREVLTATRDAPAAVATPGTDLAC